MTFNIHIIRVSLASLVMLGVVCVTPPAFAQNDRSDRAERGDSDRQRDRQNEDNRRESNGDRRSQWDFEGDATSENNKLLERILERFPDSDTDKNGTLSATEARTFIEKRRERWRGRRGGNRLEPTYDDIPYGPSPSNVIDLYLAESETPTPLVVYFHGGQFITGDERDLGTLDVRALMAAGISVASIDYRDVSLDPFPAPFEDAARAIQFLRLFAEQINIDPDRIAGHGEEAGGNLALYLALHDDLAQTRRELGLDEPSPRDPETPWPSILPAEDIDEEDQGLALRLRDEIEAWTLPEIQLMSTRLTCAVARHPIASFDVRSWKKHKLPMNGHERLFRKYLDVRYVDPLDDEDVMALVESVSPLALASADDPEVLLMSQYNDVELKDNLNWVMMRHHPKQSQLIASALKREGVKATVRYRGMANDPGISSVDFFIQKLK